MKAFFSKIYTYLRSSKAELEKVTWPTKQDTIRYSIIIVVSCLTAAAFFGLVDFGLSKTVKVIVAGKAPLTAAEEPVTPITQPPVTTEVPTIEATDSKGNPVKLDIIPSTSTR